MASTTIDALLQATTPPRTGDAAARSGDGGSAFQPALEHALAEQPHPGAGAAAGEQAAAATTSATDQRSTVGDDSQSHADEAPHDDGDRADEVDASDLSPEEAAAEDQDLTDAAEISAAAGAAATHPAAAAAQQQSTHQTAARKAAGHAIELKDAAEGSVRTARHAESGTAALTDAEDGDGDGKASAGTAKVELTSKSLGEIEPAHAVRSAEESRRRGEKNRGETKKSPPGEKPAPKTPGEKTGVAQKAGPSGDDDAGAKRSTEAPSAVKPTDLKAKSADRKDSEDGSQLDSKKPAVAPRPTTAPSTAVVAASGERSTPAPADKKELTDDIAIRPAAPNGAAAHAPSRGGASLERLSAPRGVRPAGITNDADAAGQVDRARFVGRVEGAVRAAHQRDGRVQVRLSPPELGSLRIELTMQHGALTAHVEAETASARKLLLDNLPALRERLAQQDIRVEKFDVDVQRDGGGQTRGGAPHQRGAGQPGAGRTTSDRGPPPVALSPRSDRPRQRPRRFPTRGSTCEFKTHQERRSWLRFQALIRRPARRPGRRLVRLRRSTTLTSTIFSSS